MSKPVYLWIRQDGKPPKAIAKGAKPPGPGPVFAVTPLPGTKGRLVDRARQTYALSSVDTSGMSNTEAGPFRDARDSVVEQVDLSEAEIKWADEAEGAE